MIIDKGLTRLGYWKLIALLMVAAIIAVAVEVPEATMLVSLTIAVIYISARRCKDIGWHPAWGVVSGFFWPFTIALGCFKTKKPAVPEPTKAGPDTTCILTPPNLDGTPLHKLEIELRDKEWIK